MCERRLVMVYAGLLGLLEGLNRVEGPTLCASVVEH